MIKLFKNTTQSTSINIGGNIFLEIKTNKEGSIVSIYQIREAEYGTFKEINSNDYRKRFLHPISRATEKALIKRHNDFLTNYSNSNEEYSSTVKDYLINNLKNDLTEELSNNKKEEKRKMKI